MSNNNQIEDLRKVLFVTLHRLLNKETPMDIEQAKAVAAVAQVVINSAKVELDYLRQFGGEHSSFISSIQAKHVNELSAKEDENN